MTIIGFGLLLFFVIFTGNILINFLVSRTQLQISPIQNLIISFAIGQILLIKLISIVGLLGLFSFSSLLLSCLLLFLVMSILWKKYTLSFSGLISNLKTIWGLEPKALNYLFLFIVILALMVDISPPRHADMLRYHLEYSNFIIETGNFPFLPHNQLALATDAEILFAAMITFFGVGYVKPWIFINFFLVIFSSYLFFNYFPRSESRYAIFFLIASPILFLASTIIKPDIIQFLYFINGLMLINIVIRHLDYKVLALISLMFGEIVALKWTGLIPVLSVGLTLFFALFVFEKNRKIIALVMTFIVIGVILVPILWYQRNYFATGNPIWPLLNSFFTLPNDSVFFDVASKASSRSGEIEKYGFFGYLIYTFFIYKPSLIGGVGIAYYLTWPFLHLIKKTRTILIISIFIIIYLITWFLTQASFRHLLWALPALSILGSYSYSNLRSANKSLYSYFAKFIVILIFIQLTFLFVYSGLFVKYQLGFVSDNEYFSTTPNYLTFKEIEKDISGDEGKILAIVNGSELFYLNHPHIDGNVSHSAIIDYKKNKTIDDLALKLKSLNISHILYEETLLENKVYITLNEFIRTRTLVVKNYESEIIRNRLSNSKIKRNLILVRIDS